ncbi:DegT/DnrJ/EryC1/StrS family aminotransferase [Rhodopirellula sp. P2]|uniref:DegT/DnrJ/EryC1/StrS family aminotransferase n=1 Tax=Rhodopirellula sp. P2 TaxID=2127060 RepID=UPI00236759C5|nr:DegT/DnrJ/EryC1/StrS family aminotransferase [Rhodopirellula sp. P2]WDQ18271.1 DegT/DnrJ/EryC1/StrS family aminotransferase [Rhodopirellula sp. P2]
MTPESLQAFELWMDDHLEPASSEFGRYWYPLTVPTFGRDEIAAAMNCLVNYRTSMGELTREFETQFAQYIGCHDAVMVNSGSSADLLLAYNLVNPSNPRLSAGDEVLVPAVTWPTQIWSPLMAGLKVTLVDVDPQTLNVDFDDMRRRLTSKSKCVFAVHLMGNPIDMTRMKQFCEEHDLILIEDCCESLGAKYDDQHVGNFGLGGSFSFFFSHHMTTMEGGMVTCHNEEDADALRVLRAHGWSRGLKTPAGGTPSGSANAANPTVVDDRYRFINWGFNLRPTELQAAFGLEQLKKLDGMNDRRRELAGRFATYADSQSWFECFETPAAGQASPFALPMLLKGDAVGSRTELLAHLERAGVETRPVVTGNFARQPAARLLGDVNPKDYPGAEWIHEQGFYLGLSPMMDDLKLERLIRTLDEAYAAVVRPTQIRKVA